MNHCEGCSDISARTHKHFVTRADACRGDREMQRRTAAAHRHAVFTLDVLREPLFESGDRFSERARNLTALECSDHCLYLFVSDDRLENFNHELLATSTLILSFSAPRKGPCLTLMHCMSSSTRTA